MRLTVPSGKIRSPWMGVPIPGERPIVLLTDQVRGALAGVTITDVAVTDSTKAGYYMDDPRDSQRYRAVEVTYTHGRHGRGRALFYDRGTHTTRLELHKWADKHRENRAKPAKLTGKAGEIAKQIKRLEKERKTLWLHDTPPVHPLIPMRREIDKGSTDYLRESEQRWHDEKPKRKELARISGMWLKNKLTSGTAYKTLKNAGWDVTPVSKLRTHDRERRPYQDDYWKHLHEFVNGVASNVSRRGRESWNKRPCSHLAWRGKQIMDAEESFTRHAEARLEYLVARNQARAIDIQIAALRELAMATAMAVPPVLELTESPATNWQAIRDEMEAEENNGKL